MQKINERHKENMESGNIAVTVTEYRNVTMKVTKIWTTRIKLQYIETPIWQRSNVGTILFILLRIRDIQWCHVSVIVGLPHCGPIVTEHGVAATPLVSRRQRVKIWTFGYVYLL